MQSLNSTSRAFRGDPAMKQHLLASLAERARAGCVEKTPVPSWNGTSGSLSACLAGTADPQAFEQALGMPRSIAAILDSLHGAAAAVPADDVSAAHTWLASIPPGADLSDLPAAYLAWLIRTCSPDDGLLHPEVQALAHAVADGHERTAQGRAPDASWWRAIRAKALARSDDIEGRLIESSNQPALDLVEAAVWPSASLTTMLDTLRVGMTRQMVRLSDDIARQAAWGAPQEALRQQYIAEVEAHRPLGPERAEELRTDPRYASMLARMEQARIRYFVSQPAVVLPFWEALVKLTDSNVASDGPIQREFSQERRIRR